MKDIFRLDGKIAIVTGGAGGVQAAATMTTLNLGEVLASPSRVD